jgi:hypothetical protein
MLSMLLSQEDWLDTLRDLPEPAGLRRGLARLNRRASKPNERL